MKMLQGVLAERFRLSVHRESRTMQALVLEVAKNGPRLAKSEDEEARTSSSRGMIDARKITMDRFADVLARQMDLPIVNRTGIEGAFDLKMQWTSGWRQSRERAVDIRSRATAARAASAGRENSFEMLVIDHAERPSEN